MKNITKEIPDTKNLKRVHALHDGIWFFANSWEELWEKIKEHNESKN